MVMTPIWRDNVDALSGTMSFHARRIDVNVLEGLRKNALTDPLYDKLCEDIFGSRIVGNVASEKLTQDIYHLLYRLIDVR